MIEIQMASGQSYQMPPHPDANTPPHRFKNISTSGEATIFGNGNDIEGAASYVLDSRACVTLEWIGGEWTATSAF